MVKKNFLKFSYFFSDEKNQELFVDVINGLDKNPLQYKFDKDGYRKWDILENPNNYKALISWYQKAYAAYYANRVKENPKLNPELPSADRLTPSANMKKQIINDFMELTKRLDIGNTKDEYPEMQQYLDMMALYSDQVSVNGKVKNHDKLYKSILEGFAEGKNLKEIVNGLRYNEALELMNFNAAAREKNLMSSPPQHALWFISHIPHLPTTTNTLPALL
ncbi:hypothetical protein QYZ88_016915 [Lachnospiraceae bacterium C1.1]|nr:hypothetical protein [Lachnospiraceae bacterium C1.1]